jgi:hypothetical protein
MAKNKENELNLSEHKLKLRNIELSDYDDICEIMDSVYADIGGSWTKKEMKSHLNFFSKGQI